VHPWEECSATRRQIHDIWRKYGDCILDYTEELVNKIKGQADPNRPRRAKNAGAKSRSEDFAPKITPEMIKAGEAVLDRLCEREQISTSLSLMAVVSDVYTAMDLSRRSQEEFSQRQTSAKVARDARNQGEG